MRSKRVFRQLLARAALASARWALAPVALCVLWACSLASRRATVRLRRGGAKPRLVYGPVPIISIKYMREAVSRLGYEARTFVDEVYRINARGDYDYHVEDFFGRGAGAGRARHLFLTLLAPYLVFLWLLPRFDVFHFFFDGGFLRRTPLRFFEVQLLHLAGKRVVVMPYGSDVMDLIHWRSLLFRHGILAHYPATAARRRSVARQIEYFSERADFVVGCGCFIDAMPRWDLLTTHYYPIDTDKWRPGEYRSEADGRSAEVRVFHSPNHRWLKGTDLLVSACEELRREGHLVRLVVAEGLPNSEVFKLLAESDILAEQFAMPWYGLNAMEGMSLGKPVMSDLSDAYYTEVFLRYTGLDECPIVNTPAREIKGRLRELIGDPRLRRELGEAGRRYVLKHHSYEAVGRMWDAVYRKVWHGEELDMAAWHPDRCRRAPEAPR